jgi:alpha-glucosidase
MKGKILLFVSALLSSGFLGTNAQIKNAYKVTSPDKSTSLEVTTDEGIMLYRVSFKGDEVVKWSSLGLVLNGVDIGDNPHVNGVVKNKVREKFPWRLGEDDVIYNYFNEMILDCSSSSLNYRLLVRAYDGSVAFRYEFPDQAGISKYVISRENTLFNFPVPYTIYQYLHESVFTPVDINLLEKTCDFPATLTGQKYYISIGDADNGYYTKAELKKGEGENSLGIAFFAKDPEVVYEGPFKLPWRTISISESAVGLHKFSQLYLKLAEPPAGGIPDWIKPGKLIRAQLTTQAGIDCINFAEKHNFSYIMYDAGWYGAEFRGTSDPTQVIPAIDMQKVIDYGRSKGIGVVLYVNQVGLRAKIDTLLPLFRKWGVSGIKFGFVDASTQKGRIWVTNAIRKVNDAGFILNIHDNYRPTGLSRTYPALLTQEGIRGDENSPDEFHTTTLPFTRYLAGAADFTYCFPNSKNSYSKNIKVSKAQQLALTVVYFSPIQAIFWYGNPNDYTNEEEIEFFKLVPTVWNESHYLAGDIGKNISVARRNDKTWFMGNAAGSEDWEENLRLDFLTKKTIYQATIYEDDQNGGIKKRTLKVKKGDTFSISLKAKGGQAVLLEPKN